MDASETTTEVLRAAIETALRRRDPKVCVRVEPVASRFVASVETTSDEGVCSGVLGDTADEALRRLARGVGLRPDGSDPAEEVERLREREASHAAEMERVIAVATEGVRRTEREALDHYAAAKRRMEASRDDARADLAQLAEQQQRLMTTIGEQTAEVIGARLNRTIRVELKRLRSELNAAREVVREHLAAVDEHDKARRAPAQKGSYMRLVEAQDRLDAAREAVRKIVEGDR